MLRGRAEDPLLDPFHALATAVDADEEDALLLARRLQRRIAAIRRRLVDGVDEVDLVGLLEDVLHRLAAAFRRAFVTSEPTICGLSLGEKCFLSLTAMPNPSRKPL